MSHTVRPSGVMRVLLLCLGLSYGTLAVASLYVSNAPGSGNAFVASWPNNANGNAAPNSTLTGAATMLSTPEQIAVDASWLYVANWGASDVLVFPRQTSGNVPPARTIAGSLTTLSAPQGVTTDATSIYVADWGSNSIVVFALGANGNVAPTRAISGAATLLDRPNELAVDASFIYVANGPGNNILVFPLGAAGNVAPSRVIAGAATTLSMPYGLAIDSSTIYVGNSSNGSVLTFPLGANGNTPPTHTIAGAATTLSEPAGVAVDANWIYVADYAATSVLTFPLAANGNVAPATTIAGAATTLNGPLAVALGADAVVSCPASGGLGDLTDRGFYVTDYAAGTLGDVTLQYGASTAGIYTVALTANAGAYNGPVIGTWTASAAVATSGDTPMTFQFGDAVTPGSTIAFTQALLSGPGSLYFDVGIGPCPGVTETNGTVPPLDTFRRNSVALAITSSTTPGPDLDQHGLTGSWFQPATTGQGFELEIYPDLSPGSGFAQVSWFTFDTAAGGEDHERWYTLSGSVTSGQPSAALTIYQNTGGNFNAPPTTMAQPVGTATLSFATCTSGELAYSFSDGTGRTGSIPLTRLLQNVTCATTMPFPTNADFALSGNWYAPATTGQGFTVEVNPTSDYLFAAWYTYAPMGAAAGAAGQRWYTAQAAFTPGMRTIPVTIYETTGGIFNTPTPPGEQTLAVGTGTLAFQSCTAATFSYNFTGGSNSTLSGSINLSRVGPVPPGCL